MKTFWAKKNITMRGSTNTTDAAMVRFDSPVLARAVFSRASPTARVRLSSFSR